MDQRKCPVCGRDLNQIDSSPYYNCLKCGNHFMEYLDNLYQCELPMPEILTGFKPSKPETPVSNDMNTYNTLLNMKKDKENSHVDRNKIMELLHSIMNLLHAEYHLCETIQINKDNKILVDTIAPHLIKLREMRVQAMLVLKQQRPAVKGVWCVIKHLLLAQFHMYEIYEWTFSDSILKISHDLNLLIDEILAEDNLSELEECPRCKNETSH